MKRTAENVLRTAISAALVSCVVPVCVFAVVQETQPVKEGAASTLDNILSWSGSLAAVNDEHVSKQYYLSDWDPFYVRNDSGCGAVEAWDELIDVELDSVAVAVLDTGVDATHPDLVNRVDMKHAYNAADGSREVGDTIGHGTAVAGIIAAEANNYTGVAGVAGMAPVEIIPVKCDTTDGALFVSSAISGMRYLCELVESGEVTNLRVVNFSAGGSDTIDPALKPGGTFYRYVEKLRRLGVVTVAAGGNGIKQSNGSYVATTAAVYPSDFDNVIGVTALQRDGCDAPWSDYNKNKDISAPGVDICTTTINKGFAVMDGTSAAAPIVSGTLAMMFSANDGLTPEQAIEIIKNTAGYVRPCEWKRTVSMTGSAGALDASLAVAEAINVKTSAVVDDAYKTYTAAKKGKYKGKLAKDRSFALRVTLGSDVKSWSAKATRVALGNKTVKTSKVTLSKGGKLTLKKGLKKGTWTITVKSSAKSSDGQLHNSYAHVIVKVK